MLVFLEEKECEELILNQENRTLLSFLVFDFLVIDIAALVWENLPQQELSGRLKQNFNKIFSLAIISTDLHRNTRNNDRILSHKTQNTAKRKIAYKKQRDLKQTKGISWDYGHCKQLPLAKQKQTKN